MQAIHKELADAEVTEIRRKSRKESISAAVFGFLFFGAAGGEIVGVVLDLCGVDIARLHALGNKSRGKKASPAEKQKAGHCSSELVRMRKWIDNGGRMKPLKDGATPVGKVKPFSQSQQIAILEMLDMSRLIVDGIIQDAPHTVLHDLPEQWRALNTIAKDDGK